MPPLRIFARIPLLGALLSFKLAGTFYKTARIVITSPAHPCSHVLTAIPGGYKQGLPQLCRRQLKFHLCAVVQGVRCVHPDDWAAIQFE